MYTLDEACGDGIQELLLVWSPFDDTGGIFTIVRWQTCCLVANVCVETSKVVHGVIVVLTSSGCGIGVLYVLKDGAM